MKNEKNIEALMGQLRPLGFPDGLERALRGHICLGPDRFTLPFCQRRGGDTLSVSLLFQRTQLSEFRCPYYEAGLRRPLDIPLVTVGGVDTGALEACMKAVDWRSALPAPLCEDPLPPPAAGSWEREEAIEAIMTDLERLAQTPEGAAVAALLKRKYWTDTALEAFLSGSSWAKGSEEIRQRFYFFEGEKGITLEEAYRFLCLRWRERQWQAERKERVAALEAAPGESSGGSAPVKKRDPKAARGKA